MSGIGNVGSCGGQYSAAELAAMRGSMAPPEMAEKMEGVLNDKLSEAGVSEETREAIQTEIKAAFESQVSSGTKSDPEATKEAISGIFEKYGLDAQQFMPQGGPGGPRGMGGPGGGPGGGMGPQKAGGTQTDSLQTLLEQLDELAGEGDDDADTDSILTDLSWQVMDMLFGFDAEG